MLVAGVLVSAGCSGPGDDHPAPSRTVSSPGSSATTSRSSSPMHPSGTAKPSNQPIRLHCDEGASRLKGPPSHWVAGLSSDAWPGQKFSDKKRVASGPEYHGRHIIKSVLYTKPAVTAHTRISVLRPKSARLFYTSWDNWTSSEPLSARRKITGSSRSVVVRGCGHHKSSWPGGLVVKHPGCLTVAITPGGAARNRPSLSLSVYHTAIQHPAERSGSDTGRIRRSTWTRNRNGG